MVVEPYYEGAMLAVWLTSADELPADPVTLLSGIAAGLHYLHTTKRHIHGGLSTETIYATKNGAAIGGISTQNIVQVKPSVYTAPELNDGRYGYFTDVWALGMVFLEVATKKKIDSDQLKGLNSAEL